MKVVIKFNLPEEETECKIALNAMEWAGAVWELSEKLRSIVEYDEISEETEKKIDSIRDFLFDELTDRGIRLEN